MNTTERVVRLAALGVGLSLVLFVPKVGDWIIGLLIVVALVYATTILAACIVLPEEVSVWLEKWWRR